MSCPLHMLTASLITEKTPVPLKEKLLPSPKRADPLNMGYHWNSERLENRGGFPTGRVAARGPNLQQLSRDSSPEAKQRSMRTLEVMNIARSAGIPPSEIARLLFGIETRPKDSD